MDPLTNLYDRLRDRSAFDARAGSAPNGATHDEPPRLEDWLRFWNDDDTDLSNLRNFEHWMSRARPGRG